MSRSPFDFLNSINYTKENLLKDCLPEEEKDYNSFMVNRGLSQFPDTVAIANEMNRFHHIDKKMQYDFLFNLIRKRKRMSKWAKPAREDDVKLIQEAYNYSYNKAESVIDLFNAEQLEALRKKMSKGGKSKKYK